MFEIGPSELIVVFVVALLVIGPEKLPGTVRTASLWIGRFRRSFHKIKAEVEKELNADEIKRQLHNESIMADVEKTRAKVDSFAKDIEKAASNVSKVNETGADEIQKQSVNPIGPDKTNSTPAGSAAVAKPPITDSSEDNSLAGGIKQAVSYVNDISREVKTSADEIGKGLKEPKLKKTPRTGDSQ